MQRGAVDHPGIAPLAAVNPARLQQLADVIRMVSAQLAGQGGGDPSIIVDHL